MRFLRPLAIGMLLSAVACSPSASTTTAVEGEGRAWAAIVQREAGFEAEPVVGIYRVCYAICSRARVTVEVVVYPDGTAATIDRQPPGDHNSSFQLRTIDLAASDLGQVTELMQSAGLTTGGIRAVGNRDGVVDGNGIVFVALVGSTLTQLHVPQLDPEDPEPDRRPLSELRSLLQARLDTEQGEVLPSNWVMLGEVVRGEELSFVWDQPERPQGEPPCLAFDPAQLPAELAGLVSQEEHDAHWIKFGESSHAMVGRILLPHEEGCRDVQSLVNRIQAAEDNLNLGRGG
ncbi:MAG TPA: hypothetical protein VJQ79_00945 [Acidimicrobiia bacterium]|nr:hypothetical protein [Acidimicrobiia bacterium]